MVFAAAAMPPNYRAHDSERYRLRLGIAALVSLAFHALILSLEFGIPGLGLPGLQAPWSERRAQDHSLSVQLADAERPAPPAARAASGAKVSQQPDASRAGVAKIAEPGTSQAAGNDAALAAPGTMRPSSIAILAPEEISARADSNASIADAPGATARAIAPVRAKRSLAARKRTSANTRAMIAAKSRPRAAQAKSASAFIAQIEPDLSAFSVPPASESDAPAHVEQEASTGHDMPLEEEETTVAEEVNRQPDPDLAQSEPPLTPQKNDSLAQETPRDEPTTPEAPMRARAAEQDGKSEDDARLAEQAAALKLAQEIEDRQAVERRQRAEEETRRLAELELEAQKAREARQLAARQAEDATRRAQVEAQQQAELLTQRREEEFRRSQEHAAQMKAAEAAQRALEAEQQKQAELAERERADQERTARQLQADAEQQARSRAMQAQEAAAARQAAQALAQTIERGSEPGRRENAGTSAVQTGRGESRGGTSSGRSADASENGSGAQGGQRARELPQAAAREPASPGRKADDAPEQDEAGPIMLTDAQLDSIKVAQTRTIDKTRLDAWEVRELEQAVQTERRRTLFGRAPDDIVLKMYIDEWEKQTEKTSAADGVTFPGKSSHPLLVKVSVRSDGSVEDIAILRSDGQPEADQAVRRVLAGARYKAFPRDLARRYDVIEIRRIWDFSGRLKLREAAP